MLVELKVWFRSGERKIIVGGVLSGSAGKSDDQMGFAIAKLTSIASATAENRSAKMVLADRSGFFFTGSPCLMLGFFAVKGFLSRFLDQTGLGVSQDFLTNSLNLCVCLPCIGACLFFGGYVCFGNIVGGRIEIIIYYYMR